MIFIHKIIFDDEICLITIFSAVILRFQWNNNEDHLKALGTHFPDILIQANKDRTGCKY